MQAVLVPIKIQCGCGQRYAFDVEPLAGRMPGPVSCPVCGADGTSAANMALAQTLHRSSASPVRARNQVAAATIDSGFTPLPPSARKRLPGQMNPEQAEAEARSKIMWGDDPDAVIRFLQSQGFSADDAKSTVTPLLAQRAQAVRKEGSSKVVIGIGMMCVPAIAFFVFRAVGVIPLKIFGATLVVGTIGAWRVLSGTIMFLSPRSEKGDVADM